MDQLMNFAWKFMVPLTLLNLVVAGFWHFMQPGFPRWVACGVMIAAPAAVLAHVLFAKGKIQRRVYRYAD
jgi:NADH-quinone oxidoreductase subunit H